MDMNILKFFIAVHAIIELIVEIMMRHLSITVNERTKLILRMNNLSQALDAWRVNDDGTSSEEN